MIYSALGSMPESFVIGQLYQQGSQGFSSLWNIKGCPAEEHKADVLDAVL